MPCRAAAHKAQVIYGSCGGEEDKFEFETWSGDWDYYRCVVGGLAVDGSYVETTAETTVD